MKKTYYKEHLMSILENEDIEQDTIKDCLRLILENTILDVSTEDLEYNLNNKNEGK